MCRNLAPCGMRQRLFFATEHFVRAATAALTGGMHAGPTWGIVCMDKSDKGA